MERKKGVPKLGQTSKVAKAADARSKGTKCQVKALAKARLEHDKEIRCLRNQVKEQGETLACTQTLAVHTSERLHTHMVFKL